MFKDDYYLVVCKKDYEDNLGLLTASLKSSKKGYITFSDPSIVHRAVIKTVLVPAVELEHLDKAVKPKYWYELQELVNKKDVVKVTVEDFNENKYGNLHSLGLPDEDELSSVMKWHNLTEENAKVVSLPNKYCIITKKF